jgi:hypothetical protein
MMDEEELQAKIYIYDGRYDCNKVGQYAPLYSFDTIIVGDFIPREALKSVKLDKLMRIRNKFGHRWVLHLNDNENHIEIKQYPLTPKEKILLSLKIKNLYIYIPSNNKSVNVSEDEQTIIEMHKELFENECAKCNINLQFINDEGLKALEEQFWSCNSKRKK